jgi:hypothetical protein
MQAFRENARNASRHLLAFSMYEETVDGRCFIWICFRDGLRPTNAHVTVTHHRAENAFDLTHVCTIVACSHQTQRADVAPSGCTALRGRERACRPAGTPSCLLLTRLLLLQNLMTDGRSNLVKGLAFRPRRSLSYT